MAKETAEQRLLKLIETTEAQQDGTEKTAAAPATAGGEAQAQEVLNSVRGSGLGSISLPSFLNHILGLFKRSTNDASAAARTPMTFGMREANMALLAVIIFIGVIFAREFMQGLQRSRRQMTFAKNDALRTFDELTLSAREELQDYLDLISRRNIFVPFEEKVAEEGAAEADKPKAIVTKTTDWKLVGVSWFETAETATAMIENQKTEKTHFLKKGEDIEGVKIKEIYANGVELLFEDETLMLNM